MLLCSGYLSAIGIATLAAAIATAGRRSRAEVGSPLDIVPSMPFAGPLAWLDFAQSLDPVLFAQAAEEETVAYAKLHLRDLIPDATSLRVCPETSSWIAKLSEHEAD